MHWYPARKKTIFDNILHKYCLTLNSLQNKKIIDWSELKAFADNKLSLTPLMGVVFRRAENVVGKVN